MSILITGNLEEKGAEIVIGSDSMRERSLMGLSISHLKFELKTIIKIFRHLVVLKTLPIRPNPYKALNLLPIYYPIKIIAYVV